ncbi:MAG TPA: hypothetical protein VGD17_17685 [Chitinophagaceae bacterium]
MQKRYILIVLSFLPLLFSCKKAIEKKKQDLVISAMTNGRWYVEEYLAGSTNVTSEFAGYEFQFHSDGKVDGIKDASTTTGSWAGDVNNFTITSSFPTAGLPLNRLNGIWKITENDWVYVHAYLTVGSETNYLKLHKK